MKHYTGIGTRDLTPDAYKKITSIAKKLQALCYTLRSGGADGSDSAFEDGAGNLKEIFLPWEGFNDNDSRYFNPPKKCFELASQLHPVWDKLKQGAQKLHARNTQQVLGFNLDDPSKFVLFWAKEEDGVVKGGTATAVKLARERGIKAYNLSDLETFDKIDAWLDGKLIHLSE
jgi:hypothetical protein